MKRKWFVAIVIAVVLGTAFGLLADHLGNDQPTRKQPAPAPTAVQLPPIQSCASTTVPNVACLASTSPLPHGISGGCHIAFYYTIPYIHCKIDAQPGNVADLGQHIASYGGWTEGAIAAAAALVCSVIGGAPLATICSLAAGLLAVEARVSLQRAYNNHQCWRISFDLSPLSITPTNIQFLNWGAPQHWIYALRPIGPNGQYDYQRVGWGNTDGCQTRNPQPGLV